MDQFWAQVLSEGGSRRGQALRRQSLSCLSAVHGLCVADDAAGGLSLVFIGFCTCCCVSVSVSACLCLCLFFSIIYYSDFYR